MSASDDARRAGDSKKTMVRGSAASARSVERRSPGLRGRKPSNVKRSVGSPEIESAISTALGPGIAVTVTPCATASADQSVAGVADRSACPASLITTTSVSTASAASSAAFCFSLWSCSAISRGRFAICSACSSRLRGAGVFGDDDLGVLEHLDQAARDVAEISDRCRGEDDHPLSLGGSIRSMPRVV